ncbi:Protein hgh1 [Malassezia vespertilionis]|uniref:Protein HGH1 homolog n=1 Tax=Malassezia vespertilionis TaxID=2020962 RepID=A0A2N1JBW4_9BASI|nr:Protein hgh1 [Malassezia vespertilionis]PKI84050.1 hypothetical protein MVES_001902 [Malassezia vespertilionis]WFD06658.1 Protein hgh1 [Malassezia vespertilionis]
MSLPASHELLTFLADPNPQARQVAMANIAGYSKRDHPQRYLLTEKLKDARGEPVHIWDGSELDVLEQIKELCRDQPLTMHDALSVLINLSDSPSVALRIADPKFLSFLVMYIGDSISLLADLACILVSNLTKYEPVCTRLLDLQVEDRPFYSFFSPNDLQLSLGGLDADPSDPQFEQKKAAFTAASQRLSSSVKTTEQVKVPALVKLLRAFEEGASVESSDASGSNMRERVEATQGESGSRPLALDEHGRPYVRRKSHCNFLASVFANVTVLSRGREFFVQPIFGTDRSLTDAYPVGRIMVYTEHGDLIRRGGVISALKNTLFIKHAHKTLLAPSPIMIQEGYPMSPVDILAYILMPLIDGKELAKVDLEDQEELPETCQLVDENKPRESDMALRLMLIECLLLLCTSHYGRESLRGRGAYVVVREAHLAEQNEEVTEAITRFVNLLKRDETEETKRDGVDLVPTDDVEENEEADIRLEEL